MALPVAVRVVPENVTAERLSRNVDCCTRKNPPLTESFMIQVEPGAQQEVRFDRLVTGELTLGVVEIVCEVLAQSVAMDYYAQDVAEIEEATDRIADELRIAGRIPGRIRNLTQFIVGERFT